ncbi:hypothetical protein POTOM_010163 [Populus tomentosa]|uniref:Subtilase family protein n=1 Tax=Populus tomentosa TaxID=118781 RepID=A0A8X8AD53_POPTO|nr:hypothetical protein POTOM_010163 [Populus tomentosa]
MRSERHAMKMKDLKFGPQLTAALLVLCFCYTYAVAEVKKQTKKTFIIQMDKSNMPATYYDHFQWYDSSLKSVSESADMLYTYNNIIHGFSTQLTPEEAELLEKQSGILSVLPEMIYKLHTTHTPEFLGLGKSDAVLLPASASLTMEKAVADGVNVMSMSIGGGLSDYTRDTVAIGAFRAAAQGILVSCSAGNGGPSPGSLSNVAPWITTVGAGTLDRDFPAFVSLGDGKKYSGASLYSGKPLSDSLVPLVYAGNVSNSTSGSLCMIGNLIPAQVAGKIVICDRGGNSRVQKGLVVKDSGGLGMILANTELYGEELVADEHLLPTAAVGLRTANAIKNYAFLDPKPMGTIASGGTKLGVEPSPVVAAFSSRGQPSTPFDYGAGHVNPVAALDPGLVYDATVDDYISFFCALNYSASDIKQITTKDFICDSSKKYSLGDLNYPSFSVPLQTASGKEGGAGVKSTVKYTRTLKNVGAPATYKVSMTSQTTSVKMLVEPESLSFAKEYEKKSYTVTFTATSMPSGTNSFAHLEWSDGKHVVRSPIAFSWT